MKEEIPNTSALGGFLSLPQPAQAPAPDPPGLPCPQASGGLSNVRHWQKIKGPRRKKLGYFLSPLPLGPTLEGKPSLRAFSWILTTHLPLTLWAVGGSPVPGQVFFSMPYYSPSPHRHSQQINLREGLRKRSVFLD